MDDLLTGDVFLQPVRKAPPPPGKPSQNVPNRNSLNVKNGANTKVTTRPSQRRKAPPPRPPPPKPNSSSKTSINKLENKNQRNKSIRDNKLFNRIRGHHGSSNNSSQFRSFENPVSNSTRLQTYVPTRSSNNTSNTTSNSACLIDFSSPPHSPTTGSGSDGLSINSFGSESSGHHSGGFDDNFDPFSSIQEQPIKFDPFGSIAEESSINSQSSGSGFNIMPPLNISSNNGLANKSTESRKNDDDPFEMIALRNQVSSISSNNESSASQIATVQWQSFSQTSKTPQLSQHSSLDDSGYSTASSSAPKSQFKATIIRPKATTVNNEQSLLPQSMSMPANLSHTQTAQEMTLNDQDGPPLPPRPDQDIGEDTPYGIAEFDYHSDAEGDLSFMEGDRILLLYSLNDDWMFGRSGHKEGMFPKSFINTIVPLKSNNASSCGSLSDISRDSSSSASACGSIADGNNYVTSLYDFEAETTDDLTIYEGSQILLLGRLNSDWLYGELDGQRGQFPASFVDCVPQDLKIITV